MDTLNDKRIAPHETFELHELLTFKNICTTKADAMSRLVKDDALRALLIEDFSLGVDHIRELQSLLKLSEFAPMDHDGDHHHDDIDKIHDDGHLSRDHTDAVKH